MQAKKHYHSLREALVGARDFTSFRFCSANLVDRIGQLALVWRSCTTNGFEKCACIEWTTCCFKSRVFSQINSCDQSRDRFQSHTVI